MTRSNRLALAGLLAVALPACTLFGPSEDEEKNLAQHRAGAARYYNEGDFAKSIDQARRGLEIESDEYTLLGILAWSHLRMSLRPIPDNEVHLKKAEVAFTDVLDQRSLEDHDPKNLFGYAIAQHNWARVEESRADQCRREARTLADKSQKSFRLARAEEHDRQSQHKDMQAKKYFEHVSTGSFSLRANVREAYKYLMAIAYRHKHYDDAISYGEKALAVNAKDTAAFTKRYQTTPSVESEKLARAELKGLKIDELKVRSRLAAYHRQLAQQPKNEDRKREYQAAIVHLDVILEARPNSFEDYYLRGDCHRAVGAQQKAKQDFQLFLRLGNLPSEHHAVQDAQDYLYGRGR